VIKTEFNSKAILYDKYRWDYNKNAIDFILEKADLGQSSVLLDVGAGTGILTKHFVNKVGTLYAVEPDSNMYKILNRNLEDIISIQQYSHDIPEIPDHSVDAIVVAHAIDWFDYYKTIKEFNRIAKENCFLFSINNQNISDHPIFNESGKILDKYQNTTIFNKIDRKSFPYYFANKQVDEIFFDHIADTDLETFVGSLSSISFIPSESDSSFQDFQEEATSLFLNYAKVDSRIETKIRTIVKYGLLSKNISNEKG
jgi:ubiquinone/menaquinone biosynthesis C-methylase UbiE